MPHQPTRAPAEFSAITPQLVVRGTARAIEFYARAFGAHELLRNMAPDGERVMHAELLLGAGRLLLHDEFPEHGQASPETLGGTPVTLHLTVDDADAAFARAVDAGAEVVLPLQDTFWGDRYAIVRDPFGHRWSIAAPIEDLSPRQLQGRAAEWAADHRKS
jgi:PhnB protein